MELGRRMCTFGVEAMDILGVKSSSDGDSDVSLGSLIFKAVRPSNAQFAGCTYKSKVVFLKIASTVVPIISPVIM